MNFPNITALQTIINNWNIATEETVKEEKIRVLLPLTICFTKESEGRKGFLKVSLKSMISFIQQIVSTPTILAIKSWLMQYLKNIR